MTSIPTQQSSERPGASGPCDGVIEGGLPPLIPAGTYQFRCIGWSTFKAFGRAEKLALHLRITSYGPWFEVLLMRYYNVRALVGKIGRNGRFKASASSDLVREYGSIIGFPSRSDRIALSKYFDVMLLGDVETVGTSREQAALPECLRYSTVRRLRRAPL